uniref:PABS domain-containing protein n=1 Tax=Wuchereria bancrofti TaxID=6293 RepID=A0A1I8F0R4_WUCBA
MDEVRKEQETVIRLIPPILCLSQLYKKHSGIKSKQSDSRFWKVNHTHINRHYVAVMLTVTFGAAALALSNYANLAANVLIVGLGSGSMNMFLASHFPKMAITVVELDEVVTDLTRWWFGLEKRHEKIRIVTMNGVKFIEEATFAWYVIIKFVRPAESFIRPNFTENLKKILELTSITEHFATRRRFGSNCACIPEAFPTCAVAPLLCEMNTILACQIVQHDDAYTSQQAWSYFGFLQQFSVVKVSFINGKSKEENAA